jgi:serine/threonine protein kinase
VAEGGEPKRYCPECDDLVEGPVCAIHRIATTPSRLPDAGLHAGQTIGGRYEIIEPLGQGAMGAVYVARQLSMDRRVALKVMGPQALREGNESIQRFYREARNASRLNHPNVVRIHDFGVDDELGLPFIAMELVAGRTLGSILRERGRLPLSEASTLLLQITRALAAAHDLDIVHRDLKPENMIVQTMPGGELHVTVLDFGIAKRLSGSGDGQDSDSLTVSGMIIGTPRYMSPEQARGGVVSARSDLYALGCIFFQMLEGRTPYQADTISGMMLQHLNAAVPSPAHLPPGPAGQAAAELCRSLLAKDPELRPASASAVARALEALEPGSAGYASVRSAPTLPDSDDASLDDDTVLRRKPAAPASEAGPSPDALPQALTEPMRSRPAEPNRRRSLWIAIGVGGALGLAATLALLRPGAGPHDPSSPRLVASPLVAPESTLACPVFEAKGVEAPSGWLGAATADVFCRRAQWLLGGSAARTLAPAQLLGFPPVPEEGFPLDPFAAPDVRPRSLRAARERASAWVDGTVVYDPEGQRFTVTVTIDTGEGRAGGPFEGRGRAPFEAAWAALSAAERTGAVPRAEALQPAVAHWWWLDSVEEGLDLQELILRKDSGLDAAAWCERIADPSASPALLEFAERCDARSLRAAVPAVHEDPRFADDTPRALAWRAITASAQWRQETRPRSEADALLPRLRAALDEAQEDEARFILRAAISFLLFEVEDPLFSSTARGVVDAWPREQLSLRSFYAEFSTNRPLAHIAGTHAWHPYSVDVTRRTPADQRADFVRRKYLLSGGPFSEDTVASYKVGHGLVKNGELDKARAFASSLLEGHANQARNTILIEAEVGLAEGEFARAASVLTSSESVRSYVPVIRHLRTLARVAPSLRATIEPSLSKTCDPERARADGDFNHAMMLLELAAHLGDDLGNRCLRAFDAQTRGTTEASFFASCRTGVEKWLTDDVKGAVAEWRKIRPPLWGCRMPIEAFDAVDPVFASAVDAPWLDDTTYGGAHPAQVREARRARARGDLPKARRLAERVLSAWGTADVSIPAVGHMQALLRETADDAAP